MRVTTLVSASVVAIALAATAGSVSASDRSDTPEAVKPASEASVSAPSQFATLNRVKAVPMAPRELEAVKGLHVHFTTPSQNVGHPNFGPPLEGFHFVNHRENNLGNGQAPAGAGPGYSGLCGAALNSPSLTIPGQNTTTGAGGGC